VGIGTEKKPKAMLDVNGTLRCNDFPEGNQKLEQNGFVKNG
jgi:hypothetical protein